METNDQQEVVEPQAENSAEKSEMHEGVNERLLNESKKWKEKYLNAETKYKELITEKESQVQKKLEEEKRFEDLLKTEREKTTQLENEKINLRQSLIAQKIRFKVKDLCPDALDVGDIENKLDLSELDPETGELANLATQIDSLREKRPWYFKKQVATTTAKMPGVSFNKAPARMNNNELTKTIGEQLVKRL